jgi:dUTPase
MIEAPFHFALREDLKNEKTFLPTRATPGSAGYDVKCAQIDRKPLVLRAGQYIKIPLGIRAICPIGWWLQLVPRSSTFARRQMNCLYGVIDSDYRNELSFLAEYLPDISSLGRDLILEFGTAIGQLIPKQLHEMEISELTNEDFDKYCRNEKDNKRGIGGFGSSGF